MESALNPADYLALFKGEAEDYLATLNKGLLSLEKDLTHLAVIDELFRAAHTLKGALRMMGYLEIQATAHRLEDIFGKIKNGDVIPTATIVDEALKLLDVITTQLAAVWQGKSAEDYIRIPASRIDTLLNLIGELLIYKAESSDHGMVLRRLSQQAKIAQQKLHKAGERTVHALQAIPDAAKEIMPLLHDCLVNADHLKDQLQGLAERLSDRPLHLDSVMDELQFRIKQLRMLPCSTVFDGFDRLVRDIAQDEKKNVVLLLEGAATELDKKTLEGIKPCLIHLLRNAVDHGIEMPDTRIAQGKPAAGAIRVRAGQQGNKVFIEIHDDGRGIDPQQIKRIALQKKIRPESELRQMDDLQLMDLIFAPGFSTHETVTDISGRGVGMDVVRREIDLLKGQVLVNSVIGQGTTIVLELPLTMAILNVLIVEAQGQRFGLPVERVEEIVSVLPEDVQSVGSRRSMRWRDRTVPLLHLGELLGLPQDESAAPSSGRATPVVVVSHGIHRMAFRVDRVAGEEDVFLKTLDAQLGALPNVSGVTLLGSGEVLVILNVADMLASAQKMPRAAPAAPFSPVKAPRRILVVEDSLTSREMERMILESHGYRVETAVDGLDALEKLAQKPVDLVVSDVEMPRMGGFDFCRSLRQRAETKNLPVIFITSLDKEEEKRKGIEAGGQAYITKGRFDQNNLLEMIERLVGSS